MAATQHSSLDLRIGDWLIQPRLSRIEGTGETVHVTPRAMAVLVYLAQKQGAVVSRNELLDAIWPRMAVTQDALSQCLVELRKAFGDDPKNPRVIETIPKVGVRLIAPISAVQPARPEEPPAEAPNDNTTRRWSPTKTAWLTTAAVALVGVVLLVASRFSEPTDPTASQRSQLSLAAADPEARDFYLSAVGEYSSRPDRREALRYEVDLLERAVAKDPSFALAWARLGWTHTAFYFQDIDRTAARLALARRALDTALTLDPELPEGRLSLGNYYYRGLGDYEAALAEFATVEKSLAENPDLHLVLASIHRARGEWSVALEESQRAVELNSRNPFYLRQLFTTQMYLRDYASADATLDQILMLYPDDGTAHAHKVFLALVGRGNSELAHRYDEIPPPGYVDTSSYPYVRWLSAIFDRDYGKALAVLKDAPGDVLFDVDMQSPRSPKTLFYARTHALAGDHELARAEYESTARDARARLADRVDEGAFAPAALYLALAEAEAGLGNQESARAAARNANELVSSLPDVPQKAEWQITYAIRVLLSLSDDEAVLDELESYLGKPGTWSIEGLQRDPRLDPILDNPRFAALVEAYGRN